MLLFRSHPTQYLVLIRSDFRRGGRSAAEVGAAWFSPRKKQEGERKVSNANFVTNNGGWPRYTNSIPKLVPGVGCLFRATASFLESADSFFTGWPPWFRPSDTLPPCPITGSFPSKDTWYQEGHRSSGPGTLPSGPPA